jgi:hypothetical protein
MNRHERRKAKVKTRSVSKTYKQLHDDFDIHVASARSSATGQEVVEMAANAAGRATVQSLFPEVEWKGRAGFANGKTAFPVDGWEFTQIRVTGIPAHFTDERPEDCRIDAVACAVALSLAHHADRGVVHWADGKVNIYRPERKDPSTHRDFVVEYSQPEKLEGAPC